LKIIVDINSKIGFGELKGLSFFEIYKFSYSYLEWLIAETDLAFKDLDEFYMYGRPFDLNSSSLSVEANQALISHVTQNNKPSIYNHKRINYRNIKYLKEIGVLEYKNLKEMDYHFPDEIVRINSEKLKSQIE
jgi:hypothetical protein